MNQGDIYFVSLDPTIGREQRGLRPVMVLSHRNFQRITGTAIIASITTGGQFARKRGFTVDLDGSGTKTAGVVRCDQIRTLDLSGRNARFVESAPRKVLYDVLDLLVNIVDPNG